EHGGRGGGILDDSCDLAEVTVGIFWLGCLHGGSRVDICTPGREADRGSRDCEAFEGCAVSREGDRRFGYCDGRYGERCGYRADGRAEGQFQDCISHGRTRVTARAAGGYCTASQRHSCQLRNTLTTIARAWVRWSGLHTARGALGRSLAYRTPMPYECSSPLNHKNSAQN